ncbi:MAG: hypothetical protein WCJ94_00675 [bacterium]
MKKLILCLFLVITPAILFAVQARNLEILDVPTANSLIKGEIRGDFKFYPGGGILNRLYVGLFDRLFIGGSMRVDNLVGRGNLSFEIPWFLIKFRFTDDEGYMPAIAIGYEAPGYYEVPTKGAYVAATKELALGSVIAQFTGTVYANDFKNFGKGVDMGAGVEFAITKEFNLGTECDGIFGARPNARYVNLVAGYFFDPIQIDVGLKFNLNNDVSRILRIIYITYF